MDFSSLASGVWADGGLAEPRNWATIAVAGIAAAGVAASVGGLAGGRGNTDVVDVAKVTMQVRRWREERMAADVEALEAVEARLKREGKAAREEDVIGASAAALSGMIVSGKLTSEAVVAFFARRVVDLHPALNAVTETRFREALEEAREADAAIAEGKAPSGPLHGVPISIKDQIHQEGMHTTMAAAWFGQHGVQKADGAVAKVIRSTGAIPFVRSTVPQLLMAPETVSNLWGTTCNPYDTGRASGGSSGGEGALVGSACSPLGVGTDIGGSLRIPASHCGVSTLKGTPQRLSCKGIGVPRGPPFRDPVSGACFTGNDGMRSAWGPVARHPDDVEAIMEAMMSPLARSLDPTLPRAFWDRAMAAQPEAGPKTGRPLRVGVLPGGDGFFTPSDASRRAVEDVAEALRRRGHTVVPFDGRAARLHECALGYLAIMAADGNMRGITSGLASEAPDPVYNRLRLAASFSPGFRAAVICPALRLFGFPRMADVVWASRPKPTHELWVEAGMRDARRAAFLEQLDAQGEAAAGGPLDVLICPAYPIPATPHGASNDTSLAAAAAYTFNYLHVPAGVQTVTRVLAGEASRGCCGGEDGRDTIGTAAAATLEGAEGLPVAVQIVARPFDDEVVVRGMRAVRAAVLAAQEAGDELGTRLTPPDLPRTTVRVAGCV